MSKRGPKPKPTSLKILEGAQPCRINRDEPHIAPGSTAPPAWLDGIALEHWRELAPILARAGLLSKGDRAALAVLCDDFQKLRTNPSDSKARDRYRRMLTEFGLTPSSRSRIKAPVEKQLDELDAFDREFKKA